MDHIKVEVNAALRAVHAAGATTSDMHKACIQLQAVYARHEFALARSVVPAEDPRHKRWPMVLAAFITTACLCGVHGAARTRTQQVQQLKQAVHSMGHIRIGSPAIPVERHLAAACDSVAGLLAAERLHDTAEAALNLAVDLIQRLAECGHGNVALPVLLRLAGLAAACEGAALARLKLQQLVLALLGRHAWGPLDQADMLAPAEVRYGVHLELLNTMVRHAAQEASGEPGPLSFHAFQLCAAAWRCAAANVWLAGNLLTNDEDAHTMLQSACNAAVLGRRPPALYVRHAVAVVLAWMQMSAAVALASPADAREQSDALCLLDGQRSGVARLPPRSLCARVAPNDFVRRSSAGDALLYQSLAWHAVFRSGADLEWLRACRLGPSADGAHFHCLTCGWQAGPAMLASQGLPCASCAVLQIGIRLLADTAHRGWQQSAGSQPNVWHMLRDLVNSPAAGSSCMPQCAAALLLTLAVASGWILPSEQMLLECSSLLSKIGIAIETHLPWLAWLPQAWHAVQLSAVARAVQDLDWGHPSDVAKPVCMAALRAMCRADCTNSGSVDASIAALVAARPPQAAWLAAAQCVALASGQQAIEAGKQASQLLEFARAQYEQQQQLRESLVVYLVAQLERQGTLHAPLGTLDSPGQAPGIRSFTTRAASMAVTARVHAALYVRRHQRAAPDLLSQWLHTGRPSSSSSHTAVLATLAAWPMDAVLAVATAWPALLGRCTVEDLETAWSASTGWGAALDDAMLFAIVALSTPSLSETGVHLANALLQPHCAFENTCAAEAASCWFRAWAAQRAQMPLPDTTATLAALERCFYHQTSLAMREAERLDSSLQAITTCNSAWASCTGAVVKAAKLFLALCVLNAGAANGFVMTADEIDHAMAKQASLLRAAMSYSTQAMLGAGTWCSAITQPCVQTLTGLLVSLVAATQACRTLCKPLEFVCRGALRGVIGWASAVLAGVHDSTASIESGALLQVFPLQAREQLKALRARTLTQRDIQPCSLLSLLAAAHQLWWQSQAMQRGMGASSQSQSPADLERALEHLASAPASLAALQWPAEGSACPAPWPAPGLDCADTVDDAVADIRARAEVLAVAIGCGLGDAACSEWVQAMAYLARHCKDQRTASRCQLVVLTELGWQLAHIAAQCSGSVDLPASVSQELERWSEVMQAVLWGSSPLEGKQQALMAQLQCGQALHRAGRLLPARHGGWPTRIFTTMEQVVGIGLPEACMWVARHGSDLLLAAPGQVSSLQAMLAEPACAVIASAGMPSLGLLCMIPVVLQAEPSQPATLENVAQALHGPARHAIAQLVLACPGFANAMDICDTGAHAALVRGQLQAGWDLHGAAGSARHAWAWGMTAPVVHQALHAACMPAATPLSIAHLPQCAAFQVSRGFRSGANTSAECLSVPLHPREGCLEPTQLCPTIQAAVEWAARSMAWWRADSSSSLCVRVLCHAVQLAVSRGVNMPAEFLHSAAAGLTEAVQQCTRVWTAMSADSPWRTDVVNWCIAALQLSAAAGAWHTAWLSDGQVTEQTSAVCAGLDIAVAQSVWAFSALLSEAAQQRCLPAALRQLLAQAHAIAAAQDTGSGDTVLHNFARAAWQALQSETQQSSHATFAQLPRAHAAAQQRAAIRAHFGMTARQTSELTAAVDMQDPQNWPWCLPLPDLQARAEAYSRVGRAPLPLLDAVVAGQASWTGHGWGAPPEACASNPSLPALTNAEQPEWPASFGLAVQAASILARSAETDAVLSALQLVLPGANEVRALAAAVMPAWSSESAVAAFADRLQDHPSESFHDIAIQGAASAHAVRAWLTGGAGSEAPIGRRARRAAAYMPQDAAASLAAAYSSCNSTEALSSSIVMHAWSHQADQLRSRDAAEWARSAMPGVLARWVPVHVPARGPSARSTGSTGQLDLVACCSQLLDVAAANALPTLTPQLQTVRDTCLQAAAQGQDRHKLLLGSLETALQRALPLQMPALRAGVSPALRLPAPEETVLCQAVACVRAQVNLVQIGMEPLPTLSASQLACLASSLQVDLPPLLGQAGNVSDGSQEPGHHVAAWTSIALQSDSKPAGDVDNPQLRAVQLRLRIRAHMSAANMLDHAIQALQEQWSSAQSTQLRALRAEREQELETELGRVRLLKRLGAQGGTAEAAADAEAPGGHWKQYARNVLLSERRIKQAKDAEVVAQQRARQYLHASILHHAHILALCASDADPGSHSAVSASAVRMLRIVVQFGQRDAGARQAVARVLPRIPARAWLPVLQQLVAHVPGSELVADPAHGMEFMAREAQVDDAAPSFSLLLITIILAVVEQFPHDAAAHLYLCSQVSTGSSAIKLLLRESQSKQPQATILQAYFAWYRACVELTCAKPPGSATRFSSEHTYALHSLRDRARQSLYPQLAAEEPVHLAGPDGSVTSVPQQRLICPAVLTPLTWQHASRVPSNAQLMPDLWLERVSSRFTVAASGLSAPMVLGSTVAGRRVQWLAKGGDDCRQDALIQQLFAFYNAAACGAKSNAGGGQVTYACVALSPSVGLISFVDGCTDLKHMWDQPDGLRAQLFPEDWGTDQAKARLGQAAKQDASDKQPGAATARIAAFTDVLRHTHPIGYQHWVHSCQHPAQVQQMCRTFARSSGTASALGFILGIGDRHLSNIMVHAATAHVVHIDFGYAFDQAEALRIPESVPFRLTREMLASMGAFGYGGHFLPGLTSALRVCAAHGDAIASLVHATFDRSAAGTGLDAAAVRLSSMMAARQTTQRIEGKLAGRLMPSAVQACTPGQAARALAIAATDVANLAVLFVGWQPWR